MKENKREYLETCSIILCLFIMVLCFSTQAFANKSLGANENRKTHIQAAYGKLPLSFIKNNGQLNEKVKFYEKGKGRTIFFTDEGVYLQLTRDLENDDKRFYLKTKDLRQKNRSYKIQLIKLLPLGANKNPEIIAEGVQKGKVNYFIGKRENWRTNIPTYKAVRYKDVYDDIDIRFYGNNRQFEYDIIVKPGADPSKALLSFEGIKELKVTEDGSLDIILQDGRLTQKKPYIYQDIDGTRVEIEGKFIIQNQESVYGFEVASYNRNYLLIIDPVLIYSTYLGGNVDDYGRSIAVDTNGSAYVTGSTKSTNFPNDGVIKADYIGESYDAFVTKINAAGDSLIYTTYLGGNDSDSGRGIAVDSSGNVYVTGETYSTNFPNDGIIKAGHGGYTDAFVTKINAAGDGLVYSTYLGGNDDDSGYGIAVDTSGSAYVTGWTGSTDFPNDSAIQANFVRGFADAFVTKINAAGDAIIYSTYLGGNDSDYGNGIAVDSPGNAYVTGRTASTDFPNDGVIQEKFRGFVFRSAHWTLVEFDAFVTKINAAGDAIIYSTYLGGGRSDLGNGIAVDTYGNVYVTGRTNSTDFPNDGVIQAGFGGEYNDAFVTKINATGDAIIYSTYLGGNDNDYGNSIAVDTNGSAYVTGWTNSTDFPNDSAIQIYGGSVDAFVTKINSAGDAIIYSSLLGGNDDDYGNSIAVDISGNAYVTGWTRSTDFHNDGVIQSSFGGGFSDAFVAKINRVCTPGDTQSCNTGQSGICTPGTSTCDASGSWGACTQDNQSSEEVCDGLDNDCDGTTDEGTTTCGLGECYHTIDNCVDGVTQVCDPYEGSTAESCDGLDNDCNGWIDEGCYPAEFDANVDKNDPDSDDIEICFTPNQPIANPTISIVPTLGAGTISSITSHEDPCWNAPGNDDLIYCVYYTPNPSDINVQIKIEEDTANPVDPSGVPGSAVAAFSLDTPVSDPNSLRTNSFCVTNGAGGRGSLYSDRDGSACNDNLNFTSLAGNLDLSNVPGGMGDDECITVTISEYDYTDPAISTPNTPLAIYDVSLDPHEVAIRNYRKVDIELSFELTDGSTKSQYDDRSKVFEIYYSDNGTSPWTKITSFYYANDVIWANNTSGKIFIEAAHLSTFAVTAKSAGGGSGDGGGGTQTTGGGGGGTQTTGGGGCSVTSTTRSMSTGSAFTNALIFLLPLIIFGIRRKRSAINRREK